MKKRIVKKYAHELVKSMRYWTDAKDMGYNHYKASSSRAIKGKRARQLTRDEVIAYINDHIRPLKPVYDEEHALFNANRLYIIACYTGGEQKHQDDFMVHSVGPFDQDAELPHEAWFYAYQWVDKKPTMTQQELDDAVERFMRSKGYELVESGAFKEYVNSEGDKVVGLFACAKYLEEVSRS